LIDANTSPVAIIAATTVVMPRRKPICSHAAASSSGKNIMPAKSDSLPVTKPGYAALST